MQLNLCQFMLIILDFGGIWWETTLFNMFKLNNDIMKKKIW